MPTTAGVCAFSSRGQARAFPDQQYRCLLLRKPRQHLAISHLPAALMLTLHWIVVSSILCPCMGSGSSSRPGFASRPWTLCMQSPMLCLCQLYVRTTCRILNLLKAEGTIPMHYQVCVLPQPVPWCYQQLLNVEATKQERTHRRGSTCKLLPRTAAARCIGAERCTSQHIC
jgi:hypothetical protein